MPGLGSCVKPGSHEHTACPLGEAKLTPLTPDRCLETRCLSKARKEMQAKKESPHPVPSIVVRFRTTPFTWRSPLDKGLHVIPVQSSESHRAGVKVATKPPCREEHLREHLHERWERSSKIIQKKKIEVECVICKHAEKKKTKEIDSTNSKNGGEIKKQRQSMIMICRISNTLILIINESEWVKPLLKDKIPQCFLPLIHIYAIYERNN